MRQHTGELFSQLSRQKKTSYNVPEINEQDGSL